MRVHEQHPCRWVEVEEGFARDRGKGGLSPRGRKGATVLAAQEVPAAQRELQRNGSCERGQGLSPPVGGLKKKRVLRGMGGWRIIAAR
jgi:hypothetical protein